MAEVAEATDAGGEEETVNAEADEGESEPQPGCHAAEDGVAQENHSKGYCGDEQNKHEHQCYG